MVKSLGFRVRLNIMDGSYHSVTYQFHNSTNRLTLQNLRFLLQKRETIIIITSKYCEDSVKPNLSRVPPSVGCYYLKKNKLIANMNKVGDIMPISDVETEGSGNFSNFPIFA